MCFKILISKHMAHSCKYSSHCTLHLEKECTGFGSASAVCDELLLQENYQGNSEKCMQFKKKITHILQTARVGSLNVWESLVNYSSGCQNYSQHSKGKHPSHWCFAAPFISCPSQQKPLVQIRGPSKIVSDAIRKAVMEWRSWQPIQSLEEAGRCLWISLDRLHSKYVAL